MNDRQLKELILAAKGKLPFDIYFYNARIVDVYRERIIDPLFLRARLAEWAMFHMTALSQRTKKADS